MEHTDRNEQQQLKPLHKTRHVVSENRTAISTRHQYPTSKSTKSASNARQQNLPVPWTDAEDEKLDKGLAKYGTAWTRISTDPDLGLTHRNRHQLRMRVIRREKWQRQDQESLSAGSTTEDDPAFKSGLSKDVQAMKKRVRMERELKKAEQQKHQSTKPQFLSTRPSTELRSASSLKRKADWDLRQMPIRKPRVMSTNMQRKMRLERAKKSEDTHYYDPVCAPVVLRFWSKDE